MSISTITSYWLGLLVYIEGDTEAKLIIRRNDGFESLVPVKHFFRGESDFSPIDLAADENKRGFPEPGHFVKATVHGYSKCQ
ncbi:MAG TPA: hypothetical protein VJ943_01510 [Desulfotignum sp.]|nr:hypothetical protein [Desulfotignum sp.]